MATTPRLGIPIPVVSDSMALTPPVLANIWSAVDAGIGPTICTSGTKPASPYSAQWIYQTDINRHAIWDTTINQWVTFLPNPTGIVALNNTASTASIAAINTKYMVASISGIAFEANVNYKIHVEGMVSYTSNRSTNVQCTGQGQANIHYNLAGAALTTSTVSQSQFFDAWSDKANTPNLAQANIVFDAILNTGTGSAPAGGNTLGIGWSYEMDNAFNPSASSYVATNTMLYLERC